MFKKRRKHITLQFHGNNGISVMYFALLGFSRFQCAKCPFPKFQHISEKSIYPLLVLCSAQNCFLGRTLLLQNDRDATRHQPPFS